MMRHLARLAVRCYPLAFRRRYGAELLALVDDSPARPALVADLVAGALRAHVHPPQGLTLEPADRVRASLGGLLACWAAFAVAGVAFAKGTEDAGFTAAGNAHGVLGGAHAGIQILALAGSLAVLAGAAPLLAAALRTAAHDRQVRLVLAAPLLAVTSYAVLTAALVWVARAQPAHASTGAQALFVVWCLAGVVCAVACVIAARWALFATPLGRARLAPALACGTVVTVAMAVITLATAIYAVGLQVDAPRLAATADGPFALLSTTAGLVACVAVMAVAAALGAATLRRGRQAARATGY